ncbi:MAG TPA: MFS transporter [Bryobacteraceae bacterium]|nr:MFS transporter [Bryobacteraceae bacterium]
MIKKFYGWWITVAAFITFGLAVGLPYYNLSFFYDYYTKPVEQGGFGWDRPSAILGFPLAVLLTLWVGPLLVHRYSPKKLILIGTALTCVAFLGFSQMGGDLRVYYAFWFIYTIGYIFSGPIPHQIIVSQWFRKRRGFAMGIVYCGVGIFGSLGSYLVKYVANEYGFRTALMVLGLIVLLAWPLAILLLKNKPSEVGQYPDGDDAPAADSKVEPQSFGFLLRQPAFWLLVVGSFCSIGSIGAINFHMKLVFMDQGFTNQLVLNERWATANILILWSSIAGRLFVGYVADKMSKKLVMTVTYVLVAATIPLLLLVRPETPNYIYVFAVLFGFGLGADYMLIPLMAAEQFGVNTLARAMAIILPTDTIAQTWFPYAVARLQVATGSYGTALTTVFVLAFIGAIAIALLPKTRYAMPPLAAEKPKSAAVQP